MSAITGIFYRDGRDVKPEIIKKMNNKLAHRGPDGYAVWNNGPIGLGHQMLWTTSESLHEKLPFNDEKSNLIITADARIDNRKELSTELNIEDKREISDSYFILKSYEKWGEKCPEHLLGDFAFAIWDINNAKLFGARDHMGVKPFYYYLDDEKFIFGTEIKAIFCVEDVSKKTNELDVAFQLGLISGNDRKITFYENISRLPAANLFVISKEKNYLKQFWDLDINYEIKFDSDEEYEKKFHDILTRAVRRRLRSAFPIGSMLSGGLDSSSITCIAQKILNSDKNINLKTFSAIFENVPKSNERYFIEKVLSAYEFDFYYINADEISPIGEMDQFFEFGDRPLVVPNNFMLWNIYRVAFQNDVRILLDGFDGDVTVSHGLEILVEYFRKMNFKRLFFESKALKNLKNVSYKSIFYMILFNLLPTYFKRRFLFRRENKKIRGSQTKIVKEEFSERLNLKERIVEIDLEDNEFNNAHKKHFTELNSGTIQFENELLDSMAAPFLIEPRHPFYDKELVEFCLAIPSEQKFSNGWDRHIMRRAMDGIIPNDIQWRKEKGDLSFNFDRSLMNEKKLIEEMINEIHLIEKYVDIDSIQKSYEKFVMGDTEDIMYIWNTLLLYLWFKDNFKQQKI